MEWNRVWAVGQDTYLRLYPNPGVGLCMGGKLHMEWSLRKGAKVLIHDRLEGWSQVYGGSNSPKKG